MSDPNEQRDATQQDTGSVQDETEGTVEATPDAERKAQEMDIDLASVEGTGSGGRVTVEDVENAHQRQSDSAARSIMAASSVIEVIEPKTPRDAILEQYVVLKATLAGPIEGRIDASTNEQITLDDGSKTVVVKSAGGITTINFPTKAPDFFAPFPPIVEWKLSDPQPPIPARLEVEGTKQLCRPEPCIDASLQGAGRSLLGPYEQVP